MPSIQPRSRKPAAAESATSSSSRKPAAAATSSSSSSKQLLSLLLLGDSRDRVLFGSTQGDQCTGVNTGCAGQSRRQGEGKSHCYSFQWAAPSLFPTPSYFQSAAGALCQQKQQQRPGVSSRQKQLPLAAYGYFLHYGISPQPPYLHDWLSHPHHNWSGLGWTDGGGGDQGVAAAKVNSAALAVEAAWRFASAAPSESAVCIVLSSFMWDLGRKQEHHPRQDVEAFSKEWQANYTSLVEQISRALATQDALQPNRPRSVLALTTPYDVPTTWKFYEPKHNATSRLAEMAATHARRTARFRSLPLIDWQRAFRRATAAATTTTTTTRPLSELVDIWGHPTPGAGVEIAWRELEKVLG